MPLPPKIIPVAGLGPATHACFTDIGQLKTWVPGTSPGKGLFEAKFL
jgi:hypothetical protein